MTVRVLGRSLGFSKSKESCGFVGECYESYCAGLSVVN